MSKSKKEWSKPQQYILKKERIAVLIVANSRSSGCAKNLFDKREIN